MNSLELPFEAWPKIRLLKLNARSAEDSVFLYPERKGGETAERSNRLSENLKAFQQERRKTQAEFSIELGIPKSTVQSIMVDGNTTVETLNRMANPLDVSLDELVFGELPTKQVHDIQRFLCDVGWFMKLSADKQERFRYHLGELLKLLEYDV